jgi:hypothetical protein
VAVNSQEIIPLEADVRLYLRHGFEVARRAELPGHPVPVYAMLRKPRTAR